MNNHVSQRNGVDASRGQLSSLAFSGYAHFSAMQVRDRKVRGLDLHLRRLRVASDRLFGRALSDDDIRSYLRKAIADSPADASLMVTVYPPKGEYTTAVSDVDPEVFVQTGPPSDGPRGPLRLAAVEHELFLPEVKLVGEAAKTFHLRAAVARGFDDAAFLDRHGRFSEATIWNLAFWDGTSIVWPRAEVLLGTTMSILRRQLERLDVPQTVREVRPADLPGMAGAVVMNSWTPAVPVRQLGEVPLPEAPVFVEQLRRAYAAEPLLAP